MQVRSPWRWLMIVSSASAVLPVCRSPMISSRCPRPTGIIASTVLMPVWTGVSTGERSITRGAMTSTGRGANPSGSGPLPSSGSPSGLTTRPTSPGPTGTDAMRPVRRTSSPSAIWMYGPTTMTPTDSSSRFSAMPITPCLVNSTSSSAPTLPRPYTRAMPSPICTTEPTSRVSTVVEKFLICSTRMELISSVGAAIQTPAQTLQATADAIVDNLVPDARDHAANDGGVDPRAYGDQLGISIQVGGQSLSHQLFHVRIERDRGSDLGGDDATPLIDQGVQRFRDAWHLVEPRAIGQDVQEVAHQRWRGRQQPIERRVLLRHRHDRAEKDRPGARHP